MRTIQVETLEQTSFLPFGFMANQINPNAEKIGSDPIEFYRDMAQLDLGTASKASFSTCRVEQREFIIDMTEYHSSTGEALLPLDADVLIHVAPATPNGVVPLEKLRVFRVPRGTLVVLRPGVWHHAPFSIQGVANVLIVLPERTYANDCTVVELAVTDRIRIAI
jgi:ureidoglycolate lyase